MLERAGYRLRQTWLALTSRVAAADREVIGSVLGAELARLFGRLQPGEQAHSLAVLRRLAGPDIPLELRQAALLHDVGKCRRPLRLWQRAWIVLAKSLAPERARRWGQAQGELGRLPGWQQALVVAEQHPAWGAELAAQAGAAELVVNLIRAHQQPPDPAALDGFNHLLRRLQAADDES